MKNVFQHIGYRVRIVTKFNSCVYEGTVFCLNATDESVTLRDVFCATTGRQLDFVVLAKQNIAEAGALDSSPRNKSPLSQYSLPALHKHVTATSNESLQPHLRSRSRLRRPQERPQTLLNANSEMEYSLPGATPRLGQESVAYFKEALDFQAQVQRHNSTHENKKIQLPLSEATPRILPRAARERFLLSVQRRPQRSVSTLHKNSSSPGTRHLPPRNAVLYEHLLNRRSVLQVGGQKQGGGLQSYERTPKQCAANASPSPPVYQGNQPFAYLRKYFLKQLNTRVTPKPIVVASSAVQKQVEILRANFDELNHLYPLAQLQQAKLPVNSNIFTQYQN